MYLFENLRVINHLKYSVILDNKESYKSNSRELKNEKKTVLKKLKKISFNQQVAQESFF